MRYVDLFSGAGGLSLGAERAAHALGRPARCAYAADDDSEALAVYASNLRPEMTFAGNVSGLVGYGLDTLDEPVSLASGPTILDERLRGLVGKVDLVVAGPPCQGHSNLNNQTRRDDVRNRLYLDAVVLGTALEAPAIVVENVLGVRQSRLPVVAHSLDLLRTAGYEADCVHFEATVVGVPQTRKRAFLIARRTHGRAWRQVLEDHRRPERDLAWAIGDLEGRVPDDPSPYDAAPATDEETRRRIDWLFDNDKYELENHMRPDCHKDGHTYDSVYGRLRMDRPSGTITQGFMTMGRGRFVHPTQRRTLTPHEAARIQGFPDWYRFTDVTGRPLTRKRYEKLIGNAVPPAMGEPPIRWALEDQPS